jgi:phage tail-like protein
MDSNGLRFWMLSQSNDWLPPWRAGTAYLAGQGVVDANGNLQIVQPMTASAGNAGGISDATQPVWNTTTLGTTKDGSIVWQNQGPDTFQSGLFYCDQSKRLQLRSMRTNQAASAEDFTIATGLVETAPITQDAFGNYARWDASFGVVFAGGSGGNAATSEVVIYRPDQPNITDLAMGNDGILYIAAGGSLTLVDRRNRWPNHTLHAADFHFWRLAALPEGGVLALDRATPQLGKVAGQPLQTGPVDQPDPGVMRPCEQNANPPRLVAKFALPANERFVAIAAMYSLAATATTTAANSTQSPTQFALLSWAGNSATNTTAYLRLVNAAGTLITSASPALALTEVRLPYALAWLGGLKFAALATNLNEALIYNLSNTDLSAAATAESLIPAGETYILAANNLGPFAHSFQMPPMVANAAGSQPLLLPLLPLSLNSVAPTGATNPAAPAIIDSGIAQCIWHRVFLEAILPARCGAVLWLAASDNLSDLANPAMDWYPLTFGDVSLPDSISPDSVWAEAPTGVWQTEACEIPFGPTLLGQAPVQPSQGLYMALVQRTNTAVRNLTGRYLGVRIALNGDGRITPEIAGMRVYASRFSYVRNYLPGVYRENRFGAAADVVEESTRRDFLERFVSLFEAQLTRIEDHVANAYLLTRSESTPDSALPWLGSWIGIDSTHYPPDRRRARLDATPFLYKWRGTVQGITRALDVATNGMCSSGAIIVIEDYRLRHIFATILGADLSISTNPLLPGYSGSSNSFVGDTLFLGNPDIQAELQALYANDLQIAGSARAVAQFYDQLANRMTVFVHNKVQNVNLNLVARIVEAEKPAHVQAFVKVARAPLMIGLASLVGVNTYLGPGPEPGTATLDVTDIGRYDVVTHMPSLDPRMENGPQTMSDPVPMANIKAPVAVVPGGTILLDGSASTAPGDLKITNYRWTLISPP